MSFYIYDETQNKNVYNSSNKKSRNDKLLTNFDGYQNYL